MLTSNLTDLESTQGRWLLPGEPNLVDVTIIHGLDILPHGSSERMVGASPSATGQKVLVWI
jgi:hypothetical protein